MLAAMGTRTLGQRMLNRLRALSGMSRVALVVYLGLAGAAAGIVAWAVVLVGHMLFEIGKPSMLSLLLAIPRGALFGILLAFILRAYWAKYPRGREPQER